LAYLLTFPVIVGAVGKGGEEREGQNGLLLIWIHGFLIDFVGQWAENGIHSLPPDTLPWCR
jgi:hypothetical protein